MSSPGHYDELFAELENRVGKLSQETLTSIIGFNAGGPVSLREIPERNTFVSCELSLYPDQIPSAEGLRFELLSANSFALDDCQRIFTTVGALSFEAQLGHGHTVDVSVAFDSDAPVVIQLSLFSRAEILGQSYGVYEILPAESAA